MKILACSDVHIFDYKQNATYDLDNIPNRLKLYESLAIDIIQHAKDNNVDVIVVAGDISHFPVVKPMVLNYLRKFLTILSSEKNIDLLLILGQHDISTKNNTVNAVHSVITSILPEQENIFYFPDSGFYESKGIKFYCESWKPEPSFKDKSADVFIGHGGVLDCLDLRGNLIRHGFEKNDLFSRYKLSIIGDIHNSSYFEQEKKLILQPGNLHCNNYNDQPECGFWTIEIDSTGFPENHKFINIHNLPHKDEYYKFVICDKPVESSNKNHFFTVKKVKEKIETKNKIAYSNANLNVYEMALNELEKLKLKDIEIAKDMIYKYLKNYIVSFKSCFKSSKVLKIKVSGFISIKELEISFEDLGSNILITGINGSGKTTLLEALLWGITGEVTTDLLIGDLVNEDYETASVEVFLEIEGEPYYIYRSTGKSSDLISNKGFSANLDTGRENSKSAGNKKILEYLGIEKEDIKKYCYYYTNNLTSFSKLSAPKKAEEILRFLNKDDLQEIRDTIDSDLKELNFKIKEYSSKVSELEYNSVRNKDSIRKFQNSIGLDIPEVLSKVNNIIGKNFENILDLQVWLENQSSELNKKDSVIKQIKSLNSEKTRMEKSLTRSKKNLEELHSEIKEKISDLQRVEESEVCPTCNREGFSDIIGIQKLKNTIDSKKDQFNKLKVEHSCLLKEFSEINKDIQIQELNSSTINPNIDLETHGIIISLLNNCGVENTDITRGKIAVLEEQNQQIQLEISHLNTLLLDEEKVFESLKAIHKLLSKDGIVTKQVLKTSITMINQELEKILVKIPDIERIELSKDLEILIKYKNQKTLRKIAACSIGQKRFIDLIFLIVFSNIAIIINGLEDIPLGCIALDEIFTFLDEDKLDAGFDVLECSLSKKRIVITHEPRIQSYFDTTIQVSNSKETGSVYQVI